ncbi:MAG: hypothetical protein IJ391_04075 [Clostridia bacterium]|nr:hypothetical protein [Clostridia bacterium]
MNISSSKKLTPEILFRLFLYFAASTAAIILSYVISSSSSFILTPVLSTVFFALFTAHTGVIAAAFALIPICFIGFTAGISAAVSVGMSVLVACVIGLSIKKGTRPSFTVMYAASALVLSEAVYTVCYSLITTGTFSVTEYFTAISDMVDYSVNTLAQYLSNTPELKLTIPNPEVYSDAMKAVFAGIYIMVQTVIASVIYLLTLTAAKLTHDSKVYSGHELFDLKPTLATVWVYVLCLAFSPILSSSTEIHFYTHLTTNIVTVLTPIFLFAGIYYLVNIKFKVEHGAPTFLIMTAIFTVVFGMFQLLFIYLIFCGVTYAIKYRSKKDADTPTEQS